MAIPQIEMADNLIVVTKALLKNRACMVPAHPSDPGKAQTNKKLSYLNIIYPCSHHKGL